MRKSMQAAAIALGFGLGASLACGAVVAATPERSGLRQAASKSLGASSPAQRAAAIRSFVMKWGPYVREVYDVDVRTWSMRLVPQFAHGDPANLEAALQRQTYEGAMAALDGVGHRLSDDKVIDALARLPAGRASEKPRIVARALGDTTQDLVYTPITPCRIVDTRNVAAGMIPANGTRNFLAAGISSYTTQGGSATNCGMNTEAPTAVALNVTAVTPVGAGYATVYAFGTTRPETASVNYAAGDIVNNAIITAIPTPTASFDFIIFTFAQSHYVVDIVGFFDNPRSSPVSCVTGTSNDLTVSPGGVGSNSPTNACPAGYGPMMVNCESLSSDMPLTAVGGTFCTAKNNGSTAANLRASWRCCRIPGR